MQAWKITYSNSKDPSQRFITGICANSREDAVTAIARFAKFPFHVERYDFLGEIHALSSNAEKRIIDYYESKKPAAAAQPEPENLVEPEPELPATVTPELYTGEDEVVNQEEQTAANEVECQYCGKVCKGQSALTYHENRCEKNPEKDKAAKKVTKK